MKTPTYGITLQDFIRQNLLIEDNIDLLKNLFTERMNQCYQDLEKMENEQIVNYMESFISDIFYHHEDLSELFFTIGLKLEDASYREEAVYCYRLSNSIHNNSKAINNLAILYAESNRISDAKMILRYGRKAFPDDTTLKENLDALN